MEKSTKITKRQILSSIAKLFDPAGWLAPVIIRAKTLMQQLWLEGLDWDDDVSVGSLTKWNNLVQDLCGIEKISIPRWINYSPNMSIQLHGFSDASQSAYCAAVYIRCQSDLEVFSNLLVAKSKVAPIQTVSLPRLELNGAVLLANLISHIISSLSLQTDDIVLWTDSSITLGWLSKPPSSWETYVANRISRIHGLVPGVIWKHVPTKENPADLGTRGCNPDDLTQNALWWHGPSWITKPPLEWPQTNPLVSNTKLKQSICLHTQMEMVDILDNFSSYKRALRVVCYIFRFYHKCSKKPQNTRLTQFADIDLTQHEMNFVKCRLITLAQKASYADDYNSLSTSNPLPNKSSLKPLNPFLDSEGIMRANGRLSQSCLPFNERYPIILPGNSTFCHLFLSHLHIFLSHADCSLMLRMAQTEFYISKLKQRIKKIIRQCKTCLIYKQQPNYQIMAPLPAERCNLSLPFQITGIDFAGPFELKSSSLRNSPYIKGYVSVFVCFSTKAVHLEPCSDLSSAAFQATFARFVGRRGLPKRVVTDNGRNFLGASRALEEEFSRFVTICAKN